MDIELIEKELDSEAQNINSLASLEEFRVKYLGRKGVVAQLTGSFPSIEPARRSEFGRRVNELKNKVNAIIKQKENIFSDFSSGAQQFSETVLDLPGIAQDIGRVHPLTQVSKEICSIFKAMGFSIAEGPEIETEFNNFTGLNIPLEHPSRDAFDTFYLDNLNLAAPNSKEGKLLLRSHTSPAQIRVMKSRKPPLAVVVPGKVYRPDATDASHSSMFHQIEGFMIDTNIKFSDLKGILEAFAKAVFGKDIKMRFRPHFFPFTEPSAEMDISCIMCKGKGCSSCGKKGWLEILGSGMIHPNVFKHVGYDPKKYTGFAFGMGVDRISMLKYRINDIRLFLENDLRFLEQF